MPARPVFDSAGNRVRYFTGPRKRAKSTKPRQHPEADLQGKCVVYLTYALPERVLWTATLSGAHLSTLQRMKAKETGLRRGLSDFVMADPGRGAFFLEVKPPQERGQHKRYLTAEQQQWADALGARWQTCHSLIEVEAALMLWSMKPRCSIEEATRYAQGIGGDPHPGGFQWWDSDD